MPCRDDQWDAHKCPECRRKHISDMSDDALLEEIAHRKAAREADAKVAAKRKKELAARDQKIGDFVAKAEKALAKIKEDVVVTFIASENDKDETQRWKRFEFPAKLEVWLLACKPMPTSMTFEKAEQKHGQWVLHSWHAHD